MGERNGLFKILGWGAFAFSASVFFLPLINPDLFWHLSAGRYIFTHLAAPRADFLSWTAQGLPWHDFEWLAQAFYYAVFLAGGFKALLVFKGLTLISILFVFKKLLGLYGRGAAAFLALPLLAAGLMSNSDLRPENFSLLFFSLVLYALERARLAGGLRPGPVPALKAFLFFAVWTNLHAGFAYGLALVGLYAAGVLLREELPVVYGRGPWARPVQSLRLCVVFFSGLTATLVNPYGWKLYAVLADHQRYMAVLEEHIQEWTSFELTNSYQWPYAFSLALVFGLALYFLLKKRHVIYEHFACLMFFAWASANHSRHIPFFMITGLAFSAALPYGRLHGRALKAAVSGLAAACAALIFWFYNCHVWPHYTGRICQFDCYSENLSAFLKTNRDELAKLRMFNPWAWGGYLGWELAPDYKVFLDGRYLFHDKLSEMAAMKNNINNWEQFVKKYDFELVLIKTDGPKIAVKQRLKSGAEKIFWRPAYLFYLPKKDWALVYWNNKIAALVRRSAVRAAWLKENEYSYFRPGDSYNLQVPLFAGEV